MCSVKATFESHKINGINVNFAPCKNQQHSIFRRRESQLCSAYSLKDERIEKTKKEKINNREKKQLLLLAFFCLVKTTNFQNKEEKTDTRIAHKLSDNELFIDTNCKSKKTFGEKGIRPPPVCIFILFFFIARNDDESCERLAGMSILDAHATPLASHSRLSSVENEPMDLMIFKFFAHHQGDVETTTPKVQKRQEP